MDIKIMLLCKDTLFCKYAINILHSFYPSSQVMVIAGNRHTRLDEDLHKYRPEYIISYLSPWILPKSLLDTARKAAINFHPGSPSTPGAAATTSQSMKKQQLMVSRVII